MFWTKVRGVEKVTLEWDGKTGCGDWVGRGEKWGRNRRVSLMRCNGLWQHRAVAAQQHSSTARHGTRSTAGCAATTARWTGSCDLVTVPLASGYSSRASRAVASGEWRVASCGASPPRGLCEALKHSATLDCKLGKLGKLNRES